MGIHESRSCHIVSASEDVEPVGQKIEPERVTEGFQAKHILKCDETGT